jgi:hypothetical protein
MATLKIWNKVCGVWEDLSLLKIWNAACNKWQSVCGLKIWNASCHKWESVVECETCDYEGILTIGSPAEGSYGYQFGFYGSIDPVDLNVDSINWTDDVVPVIMVTGYECYDEVTLYVNDVPYVLPYVGGDVVFTYSAPNTNPFPGVGETSNVKLCYGTPCTPPQ